MKTIYKYVLQVQDQQTLSLPEGAEILSVQVQYGAPTLWALVDVGAPAKAQQIHCYGTGHDVPDRPTIHIGTVQLGTYVWHFFKE
jgi:hypothetical protein